MSGTAPMTPPAPRAKRGSPAQQAAPPSPLRDSPSSPCVRLRKRVESKARTRGRGSLGLDRSAISRALCMAVVSAKDGEDAAVDDMAVYLEDEEVQESVNAVDDSSGDGTALHEACELNYPEIARLLLEHGAAVSVQRESDGSTPLEIGCAQGGVLRRVLLDHVSDLEHGEAPGGRDREDGAPEAAAAVDLVRQRRKRRRRSDRD